ncbi:MAG TPA: virion core protein (lumpy skin disease virus) [Bacteroidetes bacterium]|nr:virion core protein (lumpy skin disease virus) [Bacteroidota bacterium]
MGLFSFIRGQFIDVIEWVDPSRNTIIWKFPDEDKEVKMGAQLTVRESQQAILVNEGQCTDIYEPGRHELTTRNMPIMTSLRSWKHGFESPFKVDIYYVNTRQFTDNKWGTPSPVYIPDAQFGQVEIRAFGAYSFRVKDAKKFFTEFAGTDPHLQVEELESTLRGKLVDRFTEVVAELAEAGLSFVQLQAKKTEFTEALMPRIHDYFEQFGLDLTDFQIQSITLPPEVNEFLRKNTQMKMVGDMNKFTQFQAAKSMEDAAKAGGGMAQPGMDMASMMMTNMMMQNMQNQQGGQQNQAPAEDKNEMSRDEIMKTLKELGELKTAGILNEEEFDAKKKELLARL